MWIVGFRGIWLFPNLFDDNQTFAGSFMPVFGKGDPVVVDEDSDEEYWEFQRKLKKKKSESEKDKSEDEKVRRVIAWLESESTNMILFCSWWTIEKIEGQRRKEG